MGMDEAEAADEPARPAEAKLAIGCLALLGLQQVHEGVRYCLGSNHQDSRDFQSAWVTLLFLFLGLAVGLWNRSRVAWWLAVVVVALVAFVHVGSSIERIHHWLRPPPVVSRGGLLCGGGSSVRRFDLFLMIARSVFLVAAPSLLLLGRLRQALVR